jgi:hypothetical protein
VRTYIAFAVIPDRGSSPLIHLPWLRLAVRGSREETVEVLGQHVLELEPGESASKLTPPQIPSEYGGAGFDKVLFRFGEGANKITLNIQLGCQLALHEDRDDDFAFHHGRS